MIFVGVIVWILAANIWAAIWSYFTEVGDDITEYYSLFGISLLMWPFIAAAYLLIIVVTIIGKLGVFILGLLNQFHE